jgi:iron complex outermembrane recepter protein
MELRSLLRLWSAGLAAWSMVAGAAEAQTPPPARPETVVVTGTATPLPLAEADRDVSVLPLPAEASPLYPSWFQILQLDPALDLRQRAPGGFLGDLSIRGGGFAQTLVLINGMRVNDSQTGHFNLDLPLPLETIQSLEVLKGSASTLYGSDAIGGVVNVRTEAASQSDLRALVAAGNFGVNQQHALASFANKRLSETLAFARDFSSGFAPDRDYRNAAFSSQTLLRSRLGASDLLLAYSDRPYGADQFYGPYASWERIKTWFASVQQDLGANTEAAFAYRRHTDLYLLVRDQPLRYRNDHSAETWQADIRRHDTLPLHAVLSYGLEGLGERIESTNLGRRQRTRASGYLLYDIRALRRFSISAGLREERYGTGQWANTPTLSGAYWLSSHWKLRAAASRAFRLPSFTDLYYSDPANLGNPNLKPESATNVEGGLEGQIAPGVSGGATVFYRRDSNLIDYVRASVATPWQATNYGAISFRGVEGSLRWQPARWGQFAVGFTALSGLRLGRDPLLSKYAFSYLRQNGVVSWQGSPSPRWIARTRLGIVNRLGQDPYLLWDVSAGYASGHVRPFIQLTNLTGSSYQEIPAVAMPGRAVVGGIELGLRPAGKS